MLDAQFWQLERDNLLAVLLPVIQDAALAAVMAESAKLPVGFEFDPTLANAEAASWARQHTDDLLAQLGTTTERGVGAVVANWIESGGTPADLEAALRPILDGDEDGRDRASLVGITEATRAFAQGDNLTYQAAGLPALGYNPPAHPRCRCLTRPVRLDSGMWIIVWTTRRDEMVCVKPVETAFGVIVGCRELHNRVISEGPYFGKTLAETQAADREAQ